MANPYQSPSSDLVFPKEPHLPSRVYGVLSLVFGAVMFGVANGPGIVLRLVEMSSPHGTGDPQLPAPQANMLAAIVDGLFSPLQRYIDWTVTVMSTVMPIALLAVGVVQLWWPQRSLWPTRIWAVLALILIGVFVGLDVALRVERGLLGLQALAIYATVGLGLGSYPVVLLSVFREGRFDRAIVSPGIEVTWRQ